MLNWKLESTLAASSLKNAYCDVPPLLLSTGALSRPSTSLSEFPYCIAERRHSRRGIASSGVQSVWGAGWSLPLQPGRNAPPTARSTATAA